ncbi:hypothetical protein BLOT_003032 [Blomia tropicalis]|nr:hypothetical protein BLOT_003032 [Blomia tropicalis]
MSPWAQVPTCYAFEAVSQSIGTLAAIVNAHRFLCVLSSNVNETFPQLNPHICVTYGKLGLTCFELCLCPPLRLVGNALLMDRCSNQESFPVFSTIPAMVIIKLRQQTPSPLPQPKNEWQSSEVFHWIQLSDSIV